MQSMRGIIPQVSPVIPFSGALREASGLGSAVIPYECARGIEETRHPAAGSAPSISRSLSFRPVLLERKHQNGQRCKPRRLRPQNANNAMQSMRGIIPQVSPVIPFSGALREASGLGGAVIPYECARGIEETRRFIAGLAEKRAGSVGIFIGPEGGFAPEEITAAAGGGGWAFLCLEDGLPKSTAIVRSIISLTPSETLVVAALSKWTGRVMCACPGCAAWCARIPFWYL